MRFSRPSLLAAALLLAMPLAVPVHAQPAGCPPGLAKKNPPCVPPGLAKKSAPAGPIDIDRIRRIDTVRRTDPEWWLYDGRTYRRGDRLEGIEVIYLRPRDLARLPLLDDGRNYVIVDNEVIEVIEAGNLFVRTVGAVSALLN